MPKTSEPFIHTRALGIRPGRCSYSFTVIAIATLASLPAASLPAASLPAASLPAASLSATSEPTRRDADTGAATWETQAHGVTLSLTQLLPDQVRAFHVNRGFDLAEADIFAEACVFMAVMRNEAAPVELRFRLADGQVQQAGAVELAACSGLADLKTLICRDCTGSPGPDG